VFGLSIGTLPAASSTNASSAARAMPSATPAKLAPNS
jgi:hypothetical protein